MSANPDLVRWLTLMALFDRFGQGA